MKSVTVFFCAALLVAAPTSAQVKRNASLTHPDIVAVRDIYREVERGIAGSQFRGEKRSVEGCNPFGDDRTIFSDANGTVRKYVWEAGSSDSALVIRQYYDSAGRMRFVFVSAGAVNGSELEHRIYFGENGTRLRETRELKAGPGWTFPLFSDKEGLLASDARQAYLRECPDAVAPVSQPDARK